jgi:hypothetical protein
LSTDQARTGFVGQTYPTSCCNTLDHPQRTAVIQRGGSGNLRSCRAFFGLPGSTMSRGGGTRAKHHFLENDDLPSILTPADPDESTFTATKGGLEALFRSLKGKSRLWDSHGSAWTERLPLLAMLGLYPAVKRPIFLHKLLHVHLYHTPVPGVGALTNVEDGHNQRHRRNTGGGLVLYEPNTSKDTRLYPRCRVRVPDDRQGSRCVFYRREDMLITSGLWGILKWEDRTGLFDPYKFQSGRFCS